MERIAQGFKVFWRSERLLRRNELRQSIKKVQLTAIAAFVAVFGLGMLSLAAFFAVEPLWGKAWSALAIAGFDLALAILLIVVAGNLKPSAEIEMVQEARDLALATIEQEVALANAEFQALRKDIRHFVRHPLDSLLPGVIAPLVNGVVEDLKAKRAETRERSGTKAQSAPEPTGADEDPAKK